MAQVTFESAEAMAEALGSVEGQRAGADLANFLEMEEMRVVTSGAGDIYAASAR
jgi:hypothetical protein